MRNKEYRDEFVAAHISNTISAQIHSMRQVRKWTQAELASRCEMKQPRISALEDPDFENVEIATLRRIASAFDVALSVRFVPFSEVARRATNLDSRDFVVLEFSIDTLRGAKGLLPVGAPIRFDLTNGADDYLVQLSFSEANAGRAGERFSIPVVRPDPQLVFSGLMPALTAH